MWLSLARWPEVALVLGGCRDRGWRLFRGGLLVVPDDRARENERRADRDGKARELHG